MRREEVKNKIENQTEKKKNKSISMNPFVSIILLINLSLALSEFIFNPQAISSLYLNTIDNLTSFFFAVTDDNSHAFVSMTNGGVYVLSLIDI